MQGWIFGNPPINLALHPNGSLTLPNCYNVHLTVLTRVVKAKRLFRGKKAKRLKKAVKRLKGCYDLVTAFWPKIIPLSEHQF